MLLENKRRTHEVVEHVLDESLDEDHYKALQIKQRAKQDPAGRERTRIWAKRERFAKLRQKSRDTNEDYLDEISDKLAYNYGMKSSEDAAKRRWNDKTRGHHYMLSRDREKYNRKMRNRHEGQNRAHKRYYYGGSEELMKRVGPYRVSEEYLDETSTEKLYRYIDKAKDNAKHAQKVMKFNYKGTSDDDRKTYHDALKTRSKRERGLTSAWGKLDKRRFAGEEYLDELSKETLASYVKKRDPNFTFRDKLGGPESRKVRHGLRSAIARLAKEEYLDELNGVKVMDPIRAKSGPAVPAGRIMPKKAPAGNTGVKVMPPIRPKGGGPMVPAGRMTREEYLDELSDALLKRYYQKSRDDAIRHQDNYRDTRDTINHGINHGTMPRSSLKSLKSMADRHKAMANKRVRGMNRAKEKVV